ncbi:hypothetical protein SLEP1_g50835 [Rubroshorea leprosula]|uniref:Uncharacterized protein n=1 Tax=Rubroshorea leprosula TaxID=152421 RepID=A0AAV5M3U8_9ROSI|nr:hypothetical protein SLEP1_g50835 [Rubroshorea leprosula]
MAADESGSMLNRIRIAENEDGFLPLHMVWKQEDAWNFNIAMPLYCLDLGYPSGSHWRLIGFFGHKPKEKDEVGEVTTGENATSVSKGALVPLLKFGNKGLQRIGIVRAWLGAHGNKEGAWVCMEEHGPPID